MKEKAYQSITGSIQSSLTAFAYRQVLEARRNCFIALGKYCAYTDLGCEFADFESILQEVTEGYIQQTPEYQNAATDEDKEAVFTRYLNTFYQCYINDVYYQNYCEDI